MKITFICAEGSQTHYEEIIAYLREREYEVANLTFSEDFISTILLDKPDVCFVDSNLGQELGSVKAVLDSLSIDYPGSSAYLCKVIQEPCYVEKNLEQYHELSGEYLSAWAPKGVCFSPEIMSLQNAPQLLEKLENILPGGFPLYVKRVQNGTYSLSCVENKEDAKAVWEEARSKKETLYFFQMIDGIRLSIPVLGTGYGAYALAPVETYTLQAPVRNELLSPDESVAQAIRAEIERAALEAYRICGLKDFGCVDIIWDGAQAAVVGINPHPAFDSESALNIACKVAGITMPGLFYALLAE